MKNETGLRIMTAEGELRGCMDDDLFVFKGIPYAAAPEGGAFTMACLPPAGTRRYGRAATAKDGRHG